MYFWIVLSFCLAMCHVLMTDAVDNWSRRQIKNSDSVHPNRSLIICPQKCHCNSDTKVVNCGHVGLKKVPLDLPSYTEILQIYGNNIEALWESSFNSVPQLKYLYLNANRIKTVGNNSLSRLRNLVFLDIRSNPTKYDVLASRLFCQLRSTSIKTLIYTTPSEPYKLTSNFFDCLRNTTIEQLSILGNLAGVFHFTDNALSHFIYLKQLIIKQTRTLYGCFNTKALEFNTQLKELILQQNGINEVPIFINKKTKKEILPQLTRLDLSRNSICALTKSSFGGLLALEVLILSYNNINIIDKLFFSSFTSLKILYLNNNKLKYLNEYIFQSSNITFLQLANNKIEIDYRNQHLYTSMKHIKALYLSAIFIVMQDVFKNMTSLYLLSLRNFVITSSALSGELPLDTFWGLYNLRTLYITDSMISRLDMRMFRDLISLKKIYLFKNQIHTVSITSFPQQIWQNVELLSLADNNFMCTCDLLWFIDWVKDNENKIDNIRGMRCKYPYTDNVPIIESKITPAFCIKKPTSALTKIAFGHSVLMIIIVVAISTIIRHRWYLRSKLFHLTLWMEMPKVKQRNTGQMEEFTFDAFVSYNSEDSHWVNTVLINELEDKCDPPFKLCLYERDWIAGHSIIDCIGESIEQSRKILLIVTNAFAESQWCQLELTMAQHHLLETDNDNVIVAMMEDIDPLNMTPRLALEMKRRVYLEWTEDALGQRLFWQKLKHSLANENSCIRQAMPPRELI